MKATAKIFGAVCASAAALSMCSVISASAASEASVQLMGDLNHDMVVNAADAQDTLQLYVQSMSGNTDKAVTDDTQAADINMDGEIGLEDAASILSYYCQTLAGGQPLWAEFRTVSYEDGSHFGQISVSENPEDTGNSGEQVRNDKLFALRGLYIEIGCASGKAGETVTVPVYVAGLPKLAGFQLTVSHDPALTPADLTSNIAEDLGWNEKYSCVVTNPNAEDNRGIVVAAEANDFNIENGYIIANYSYTIPEDAKSGDCFKLAVDPTWTEFVSTECCYSNDNDKITAGAYQYTTLSGVVTVK